MTDMEWLEFCFSYAFILLGFFFQPFDTVLMLDAAAFRASAYLIVFLGR